MNAFAIQVAASETLYTEARLRTKMQRPRLCVGQLSPTAWSPPIVDIWTAPTPSDYFSVGGMRLFSENFRSYIDAAGDPIQWLPVTVSHPNLRHPDGSYWVMNDLAPVSCVDWMKSEILEATSGSHPVVFKAKSLVFHSSGIQDRTISYCHEIAAVVVSEVARHKIMQQAFSGIEFVPVDSLSSVRLALE